MRDHNSVTFTRWCRIKRKSVIGRALYSYNLSHGPIVCTHHAAGIDGVFCQFVFIFPDLSSFFTLAANVIKIQMSPKCAHREFCWAKKQHKREIVIMARSLTFICCLGDSFCHCQLLIFGLNRSEHKSNTNRWKCSYKLYLLFTEFNVLHAECCIYAGIRKHHQNCLTSGVSCTQTKQPYARAFGILNGITTVQWTSIGCDLNRITHI